MDDYFQFEGVNFMLSQRLGRDDHRMAAEFGFRQELIWMANGHS
jgi:hypothetical protein